MSAETAARKPTILLVEDEAAIRLYTEDILFDAGYEVLSASNAREALQFAERSGPIELLITDVNLPNQSGPELAEALGNSRPNMKVLYTSGDTGHLHLCASGREGAAFLPKPFVPESLTAKISEVLGKR
jgi:two-component system cell cycle sensor histidine kinase/response regulator CckA